MLPLRIFTLLAILRRPFQSSKQLDLGNCLYMRSWAQPGDSKALSIIMPKSVLVGVEPRFHGLYHQVDLILRSSLGARPPVART